MLDFSGLTSFPFPIFMNAADEPLRGYFYTLEDEMQLNLLNKSSSYDDFMNIVREHQQSE